MSNKNNDDLKRQASENTLGLNPIIALRKKDLLASAKMVLTQAIKQPLHSVKHVAHFGLELKNVLLGKSSLQPAGDDRRCDLRDRLVASKARAKGCVCCNCCCPNCH